MQKKITPHKKWRFPLIRWHRRIGITVSVLVLWLSVTGLLLNHSDQLDLARQSVGQSLLMFLYGIEKPTPVSFSSGGQWVSHLGANHVYLNDKEVAYCRAPFAGAVWLNNQHIVGCGDGLLLLTSRGEVLERLGAVYEFPGPIVALAVVDNQLLLKTPERIINADLEQLKWLPYHQVNSVAWAISREAPQVLTTELIKQSAGGGLNWERVVLDLHSGRLFGQLGVWFMDVVALLLIVLAVSGVWIWLTRPSR